MTLKPGDTVHETYHILAKLSQGGFGVVYLAYDASEQRVVAIKEARENEDAVRKLREEVGALARIYHPNLARIYDDFTSNQGRYYFVMEYIPGDCLENFVVRGQLPAVETVIEWIKQILEALAVLHAQKPPLIHRDISLRNIQIHGITGRAYLLDFGSVTTGDYTTISISEPYAPPEQYQPKRASTATDIYAVGICLYKLLTGVEPPMSLGRQSGIAIAPPRQHNRRITASLERVVLTAINLDPADRYPNARSMLKALEKANVTLNEHRSASVTPHRGSQQRRQPKRHNPQIAPARAQLEAAVRAPQNDSDLSRERLTRAKHLLARRRQQITPLLRRWRIQRHLLERRRKKVRLLLGQQQRYRRMLVRRRGKIKAELARNRQLTHQLAVATALLERRREKILTGLRQLRDHRSMIDAYETPQPTHEFGALLLRAWKTNVIQWLGFFLVIIGCGALLVLPSDFIVTYLAILTLGGYPLIALGVLSFFSLRAHGYHWKTTNSWLRLSNCVIYSLFIGLLIIALTNGHNTGAVLRIFIPLTIIGLGIVVGLLISGVLLYESRR